MHEQGMPSPRQHCVTGEHNSMPTLTPLPALHRFEHFQKTKSCSSLVCCVYMC
jgi:hypothetical protein